MRLERRGGGASEVEKNAGGEAKATTGRLEPVGRPCAGKAGDRRNGETGKGGR